METLQVRFLPADVTVSAEPGARLFELAMDAGVHINAACGGQGACGRCRVQITSGEVDCPASPKISPEDFQQGFRLACQCRVRTDLEVVVPRQTGKSVDRMPAGTASGRSARSAAVDDLLRQVGPVCLEPPVIRRSVTLEPPTLSDNTSDLTRLLRALKKDHGINEIDIEPHLISALPGALRSAGWTVTVTLDRSRPCLQVGECAGPEPLSRIVHLEPGRTQTPALALAVDIGTTSLWCQLVDTATGEVVAEASTYNPQVRYGEDVITRIVYSLKGDGLRQLQETVVGGIAELLQLVLDRSGAHARDITHVSAAGNTVMTHLFAGLDPRYIREAPYTPVANLLPPLYADETGIANLGRTRVHTLPMVASYVGGDIVAGVLCTGMSKAEQVTLYIDIGTNGEIVVGNADWLMTASCSAGPAFEGGGLRCGMRAAEGAIERVHIDAETWEPMIMTIDRAPARGICGSGAIAILAELLESGVIGQNGKFNRTLRTERVRHGIDGGEYVLVYRQDAALDEDIVITEADIDNLMRAKAAMFAGYQCLLEKVGLTFQDLDRVIIAGAFGDFIDLDKAVTIGLMPELPRERFLFIGNGSLMGARLMAVSRHLQDEAVRIARAMTNIELSEDTSFMDKYMAGLFLPHTDAALFPGFRLRSPAPDQDPSGQ